MAGYSVSLSGLSELEKIPGWLDEGQRKFLDGAVVRIAQAIGEAAPRKSGKLESSWKGDTLSSTKARVYSNSDYAKSQDRGAYIAPKKKALRFDNGHFQRVPVRLPATGYVKKGLRQRGKIVREEYKKVFDQLGGV